MQHSVMTLADLMEAVLQLGDAACVPHTAGVLADSLRSRLRQVAVRAAAAAPPKAVGHDGSGWEAGAPHAPRVLVLSSLQPLVRAGCWVPEMLALAGAQDAGSTGCQACRVQAVEPPQADSPLLHGWDTLRSMCCDILVLAAPPSAALAALPDLAASPGWWSLPAVRTGAVYIIDPGYVTRPGARLQRLCREGK